MSNLGGGWKPSSISVSNFKTPQKIDWSSVPLALIIAFLCAGVIIVGLIAVFQDLPAHQMMAKSLVVTGLIADVIGVAIISLGLMKKSAMFDAIVRDHKETYGDGDTAVLVNVDDSSQIGDVEILTQKIGLALIIVGFVEQLLSQFV